MIYYIADYRLYRKAVTVEEVRLLAEGSRLNGNKHFCLGSKQILNDTELRKIKHLYPINYGRKIGDKFIWTFII